MKNSKRMVAVIAATGLAIGTLPGVANAQGLDLGVDLDLVLGSVGGEESPLSGSLEDLGDTGSADEGTDGDDSTGDETTTGSLGGDSGSGSAEEGTDGDDSTGDETSTGSLGSSEEPEGTESEGGLFAGSLGSITDSLGDDENTEENGTEEPGSLDGLFSGSAGGDSGSGSADEGNDEDDDEDNNEIPDPTDPPTGEAGDNFSVQLTTEEVLAIAALAGVGIAIGVTIEANGGLPPLPPI